MAFTYSGNPGDSARDALRFEIGDTDERWSLLGDGELDYLLAQSHQVVTRAARLALEAMMARASGLVDESVGSVSKSWSQRLTNLKALIAENEARLGRDVPGIPRAGGLTYSSKYLNRANPDSVQPRFTKGDTRQPNDLGFGGSSLRGGTWR